MVVQDIIDIAKYSELNNLAVKNDVDAIVAFINMGLLELHKRFPLSIEEHIVSLQEGVTLYSLPSNFMYALEAYGEVDLTTGVLNEPNRIPINDVDDPESIFFPNFTQVQVPLTATGAYVSIIYVTKPVRITTDDLSTEISIPETLIDALLHYVGYRAHSGIRGDGQAENNMYYARFERSCEKARELGVAYPLDSWKMSNRLLDRGFV